MKVSELISKLQEVQALWNGYDPEVRFYTEYKRDAADDQIQAEPVVFADYENEPTTCSVELYEEEH